MHVVKEIGSSHVTNRGESIVTVAALLVASVGKHVAAIDETEADLNLTMLDAISVGPSALPYAFGTSGTRAL